MKLFISLSLVLIVQLYLLPVALAQVAVQGEILDEQQQPTPYTTVVLLSPSDSSVVQGKITDEEGSFLFEQVLSGEYLLNVSFVGYKTFYQNLTVANTDVDVEDITLVEASQTLDEVTVSAQRSLVEKKPDRLVVNLENSILTKGAMANEILRAVPLVSTDMSGGIKLRGKSNVMVLIDGKTIPETTLSTVLENLSAEQIAKIEVITNPSAKYDAAASGGVINVITKDGLQQGLTGTARVLLSKGLRGRATTGVTLNYRTPRLQLSGNLNYSYVENYRNEYGLRNFLSVGSSTETRTEYFANYQVPSGKLSLDYDLHPNHQIGGAIEAYYFDFDLPIETTTSFFSGSSQPDSTLFSDGSEINTSSMYNMNLNYQGQLSDQGHKLSLNATHTIYQQDSRQTLLYRQIFGEDGTDDDQRGIRTVTPSDIRITIAQLDYTHPFTKNITAEAGVKYTGTVTDNEINQEELANDRWTVLQASTTGYTEAIYAGYVSTSATLGEVTLQAGLRAEQTDAQLQDTITRNFLNFFPSILLARDINEHHSLSLSYSRKIDRPAYDNLIPFQSFVDPYSARVGNPLLQPQYSNVLELSNTFKDITLLASYTHTREVMLDIPFQDPETLFTTYTFQNLSRAESYSLSLVLPLQLSTWWQSNNTVTGMYNMFSDPNINGVAFQQDIFAFTINSTNTFQFANDWKAELIGYYNSANQYGISQLQPIYSVQAAVSKDIWQGRGNVKVGVDDIFWSDRWRFSTDGGGISDIGRNYMDTRRVRIGFTYKFGKTTVKPIQDKSLGNESEQGRLSF